MLFVLIDNIFIIFNDMHFVIVIAWLLGLQLPMPTLPITTEVVSSNPAQARCTRYNII